MANDKVQGWSEPEDGDQGSQANTELEADPNPGRFVQSGGGKIYRDGVLVEDLDSDDE